MKNAIGFLERISGRPEYDPFRRKELKGFAKVFLKAGEKKTVAVEGTEESRFHGIGRMDAVPSSLLLRRGIKIAIKVLIAGFFCRYMLTSTEWTNRSSL